ncbi:MAG: molybdopterin-guanine dinucleotide biosynthesis protein B [Armatimonadota bacterium]|nr:molybdopterin-guanine dinucleotide biosynthesis protein B [Armatimonadota bacterium]
MSHDRKTRPFALAIVGASGTGKTTLIERLVPEMTGHGLKVGTVKHDAHEFEIDRPGKDSYRHKAAGASTAVITCDKKLALVTDLDAPAPIERVIGWFFTDCDIVVVEGYHLSSLPKIWVRRKGIPDDHIQATSILATLTYDIDGAESGVASRVVEELADLILQAMVSGSESQVAPGRVFRG